MSNEIIFSEQIFDNVFERKVLFEKYDPYLGYILLTDFENWIYPNVNLDLLNEAINKTKEINQIFGEFGQPDSYVISMANVSHLISDVFLLGSKVYGKVTFLDTLQGRILKELSKNKFEITFSIRATGVVTHENITEIQEIIAWDAKTI